ncbi:MAG: leucine-rich repeat domain-containing protein [Candidatus Limisoma sp.]
MNKRNYFFVAMLALLTFGYGYSYDFKDEQFAYNFTDDGNVAITYLSQEADANSQYAKGEVTIPESVNINDVTYRVTEIGESAFHDCMDITTVKLTNNIIFIRDYAFQGCTSLSKLVIPTSVSKIFKYALAGCTGLKEFVVEDSSEDIDFGNLESPSHALFADCPLETVYLGRKYLFFGTTRPLGGITTLKNLTIGNMIGEIYPYAFKDCTALENVVLGNQITAIGNEVFSNCSALQYISFPESLESIGSSAFYGSGLKELVLPGNVTKVSSGFKNCTALTKLVIEDSETTLDMYVDDFKYVETLYLGRNLRGQYAYVNHFPALKYAEIGPNVTTIDDYLFSGSSLLQLIEVKADANSTKMLTDSQSDVNKLVLTNSITEIGGNAFSYCTGLTEITLPENLSLVGGSAFSKCENIQVVKSLNSCPPTLGSNVFNVATIQNAVLQVPEDAVSTYSQAEGWNFSNIIGLSGVNAITEKANPDFVISDGVIVLNQGVKSACLYSVSGQRIPLPKSNVISGLHKGLYILVVDGIAHKVAM